MNFLLALMKDLRVPVVVIGLSGAATFLSNEMQDGRRFSSGGHFAMNGLRQGAELAGFVRLLWGRRLLRETPDWGQLTEEQREAILRTIWFVSAGIHDLVVRSFMFAQIRALESGRETLTPEIFEEVYNTDFAMMRVVIRKLRGSNPVSDVEWDEAREAVPGTGDKAVATALATAAGEEASEVQAGQKQAKRKRVKNASPPHRERKAESREAAAAIEGLREAGLIGRQVTGPGGDVV